MTPKVKSFFDPATYTFSYVVYDPESRACVIIDSVLNFDYAAGRLTSDSADQILQYIDTEGLDVQWILETHVHADHLTAAAYLKEKTGAPCGIGSGVVSVQKTFSEAFNLSDECNWDGSQFDRLFDDDEALQVGNFTAKILHTPGHTPGCVTYHLEDCAFVGDTLFMPDYGTARCDFPGGDAAQLYRSIQRILSLPPQTRLFMCHDYKAPGRDEYACETTVAEQRRLNIHIHDEIGEQQFVRQRSERDKTLAMPALIFPAVQVNMRAGALPPVESNGHQYLKVPLNLF